MTFRRIVILIVGVALAAILISSINNLWETVDASEYVVKQPFFGGELVVWDDPGPHWQGFGKCTHYPFSRPFNFEAQKDHRTRAALAKDPEAYKNDKSLKTKFRDGAEGWVSGSLRYEMPTSYKDRIALHKQFGSANAVEHDLVRAVIENAVFVSGRFMTSSQSFAEKRAELPVYIEQQAKMGKLGSREECADVEDASTKTKKNKCETHVLIKEGVPVITEKSPVTDYNVKLTNFNFNGIRYEDSIQAQMDAQQQSMAAVNTAEARAKQSIQDAITTEQDGKAKAAKAEWEQKAISAKLVAEAEQQRDVAKLAKESAEYTKQKLILEGEGEAKKRELIMKADGALSVRIEADIKKAQIWADAYSKQRPTPDVVLGSSGSSSDLGTVMMMAAARQAGILSSK